VTRSLRGKGEKGGKIPSRKKCGGPWSLIVSTHREVKREHSSSLCGEKERENLVLVLLQGPVGEVRYVPITERKEEESRGRWALGQGKKGSGSRCRAKKSLSQGRRRRGEAFTRGRRRFRSRPCRKSCEERGKNPTRGGPRRRTTARRENYASSE